MVVVVQKSDLDGEEGEVKKRSWKRRVSHGEESCPCRGRVAGGGARAAVVVVAGEEGNESKGNKNRICVLRDECEGVRNKWGTMTGGGGGSLDRRMEGRGKRFSIASNSSASSMSVLSLSRGIDTGNGDVNNNCSRNINHNNKEGEEEEGRRVRRQNRRNEAKEESFGSASSFTKDIMRMIERNNNNNHSNTSPSHTGEDPEMVTEQEAVVLAMNRRNSDMSGGKRHSRRSSASQVTCECACHEEAALLWQRGKKKGSPNRIYSIADQPEGENGNDGGDEGDDWEDGVGDREEYDNDEEKELADVDEGDQRQRRRSVL